VAKNPLHKPEEEHASVDNPTSNAANLLTVFLRGSGGGRGLWTFGFADFSLSCLTCQQSIQKGLGGWFSLAAFMALIFASTSLIFVLLVADIVQRRAIDTNNELVAYLQKRIIAWLKRR
jgi:hypothetical protein